MNLVEERNSWHKLFDEGYKPKLLEGCYIPPEDYLKEYRILRESEIWRSTRALEQYLEYQLWLEKQDE